MLLVYRVFYTHIIFVCFLCLSLTVAACSEEDPDSRDEPSKEDGLDLSKTLFELDHLVEVEIELDPADWDTIRHEGRDIKDVFSGCITEYEYTYVAATVTVDGETFEDVAVRKKGYLGSLSRIRPSLKLNFGKLVEDRTAWGMKRMTLNNDKQDVSHTHQCMAYQLFRDAESVAPRCNLARVTVNGKDLGIYTHLESIKKPFLARHFDDDDGNLYEGQQADFYPGMTSRFEKKTNEKENDRSDLDKVVKAMEAEDDALFESLEEVFDMDAFLTHWAMEVITGHWDSYSGNQNNFYIYREPNSDQFYFVPWGTDDAFNPGHSFLPPDIPVSVYAWSWPTYRLYAHAGSRIKYQQRLRDLLEDIWDEDHLLAEVDRIEELTDADEASLEKQRKFISDRKQKLLDELDSGDVEWSYMPKPSLPESTCLPSFDISGTFDTTWGDANADIALSDKSAYTLEQSEVPSTLGFLDLHVEEIQSPPAIYLASAGFADGSSSEVAAGTPQIWIIKVPESGGAPVVVSLMFESSLFGQKKIEFHGMETFGAVVRSDENGENQVILGFIGDGMVEFDEVGTNDGDPVKGKFNGVFLPMIFDQLKNTSPDQLNNEFPKL